MGAVLPALVTHLSSGAVPAASGRTHTQLKLYLHHTHTFSPKPAKGENQVTGPRCPLTSVARPRGRQHPAEAPTTLRAQHLHTAPVPSVVPLQGWAAPGAAASSWVTPTMVINRVILTATLPKAGLTQTFLASLLLLLGLSMWDGVPPEGQRWLLLLLMYSSLLLVLLLETGHSSGNIPQFILGS